ncbi:hypothetical protein N7448_001262 [Penicillium atrosanguineum]|uniref:Uncharacterized protein n=1 Tax=Penicillium atrosanguineum TaxID=1132637 RepID=A0A9W9U8S1_9EURO|nr:Saccharopine dehydrogenase [Penicillium atrosanguineum]KAJ5133714.1 hypothetical protein N7526_005079 [Penicillium atrosanguineum]KAJ5149684.1 hypothetical protein N7448_001262 [Penicillium atrosanguineum]KAJ5305001.1 Saccharopine dehydrogenase [Penicillium atrosanguineum]KAJ5324467.1 hypothetical protein N7476_003067 [Penicillium atrosanguineum]
MKSDPQAVKDVVYPCQDTHVIVPASVDRIRTKNLYLRPLEIGDAAALYEFRSRQDVADWLWPKVPHQNIQETEANILNKTFKTPDASGALGRQFTFAVISATDPTQKVIGAVGINGLVPSPSIGYGIHPDFWGKGYVSEAVAAVVDAWWKLSREEPEPRMELNVEREKLFAAVNKANVGSVKVLQKNGFEIVSEASLGGDTVVLFALERPAR